MCVQVNGVWFTKGFSAYAQGYCSKCSVCAAFNPARPIKTAHQAAHPPPTRPFEHATKLAKCCEETGLTWTKALPLVWTHMRMRKRNRSNLGSFETLFAAPPFVGLPRPKMPLPSTSLCEDVMFTYCSNLSKSLSAIRQQVEAALPGPATGPPAQPQPR